MSGPADGEHLRSVVLFQLTLLDLYESLLGMGAWDEAKVNTTLKTFMSSVLALLQVQRTLGSQMVVMQHELIRQHRSRLEQWLEEHGPTTPSGAAPTAAPAPTGVPAPPDDRATTDGEGWNGAARRRPDERVTRGPAE